MIGLFRALVRKQTFKLMTDEQAEQLLEQNKQLLEKVSSLEAELLVQKDLVAALLKKLYGAKSEKLSTDQLLMAFLEDESKKQDAAGPEEGPAAESKPSKNKRQPRQSRLAASLQSLPAIERIVTDPEVLADPDAYRLLGEEISERLRVKPAVFTREVIRRQTHVRKNDPDNQPLTPPLEPCLLPGSVLSPSLGAYLLTQKFCYHSTFYREEWKLKAAYGIELSRNLMCSWHNHLAERLVPLYELIAQRISQSGYVKADETPIDYLEPGTGKAQTGYLWTYHHATHGPIYDWHSSRANTCLDRILIGDSEKGESSFQGHLQSDGLQAYRTFRERHPHLDIIPVSCLAHIRRKFIEAQNDQPKYTAWILHQIGKIYGIENQLRASRAGPLERQRQRWLQTRRHYDHLGKLFKHLQLKRRILPKSQLGKALNYALDQWKQLEPCFHDGQIEFDNNHTENAIRPTKLGAKNWLFIGRDETGWRSAIVYTMVEQVRRHGRDPFAYFEWVFEKLMHNPAEEDIPSLLPTSWLEAQDASECLPQKAA